MNEQLQLLARAALKNGLAQLPEGHQDLFKRMYSSHDRSATINEVVDAMSSSRLDMAMQQVERSIDAEKEKADESREKKEIADKLINELCLSRRAEPRYCSIVDMIIDKGYRLEDANHD